MDALQRFGDYQLAPADQISLRDNFRDVVTRTTRLPFTDGGYDELNQRPGPREVGNVQMVFWIIGDVHHVREKLDYYAGLARLGPQKLYKMRMGDGREVYTPARLQNMDYSMAARDMPHERARVQLNFQCPEPFWYADPVVNSAWGGSSWGTATWGETPITVSGTTTITRNNEGNVPARVRFVFRATAPTTAVSVECGDQVITLTRALAINDIAEIDTRRLRARVNGAGAYDNLTTTAVPWLVLQPGDNTIDISVTGTCHVRVIYAHTWI